MMGPAKLQEEDRDGFRFRGGSLPLDLTATRQGRLKPSPRELLATPADLDRWLLSSGMTARAPRASEKDLALARSLREAIYSLAISPDRGSFQTPAMETLNEVAALPPAIPALRPGGLVEVEPYAPGLLSQIARDAIYLLGEGDTSRLRQCDAPNCTILFVDTSRSADRRWCSMAACGNKAKVTEHRRRRADAARRSRERPEREESQCNH